MFSDSTGPNQWVPFDSRVDAVASFQRLFGSGPYGDLLHSSKCSFLIISGNTWEESTVLAAAQT